MSEVIFLTGDSRVCLDQLPAESVHCAITSPPYFGLRDYGVAGQIGLESNLNDYIGALVSTFRALRRVLRPDGTLWLNLGDSYAAGKAGRTDHGSGSASSRLGPKRDGLPGGRPPGNIIPRKPPAGLCAKSLIGVPWRVAFALQADGWILRSDIIWAKGNPMPESVTDRPTRSHEYLFLLTKSARYFYDPDGIREPAVSKPQRRLTSHSAHPKGESAYGAHRRPAYPESQKETPGVLVHPLGRNKRSVWHINARNFKGAHFATFPPDLVRPCILAGCPEGGVALDPFAGAGTVGLVARELNRHAILIDLNPEYIEMARQRIFS